MYLDATLPEMEEELVVLIDQDLLVAGDKVFIESPLGNEFCQLFRYTLKATDKVSVNDDEVSEIQFVSEVQLRRMLSDSATQWNPKPHVVLKE